MCGVDRRRHHDLREVTSIDFNRGHTRSRKSGGTDRVRWKEGWPDQNRAAVGRPGGAGSEIHRCIPQGSRRGRIDINEPILLDDRWLVRVVPSRLELADESLVRVAVPGLRHVSRRHRGYRKATVGGYRQVDLKDR